MLSRLHNFILSRQLIIPNDLVFAAVSGGKDSMVMLHLLQQLVAEIPFELRVVHFNHAQRKAESDGDADFVQRYCEKQRISFYVGESTDLAPGASEDALRNARYTWFDSILRQHVHAKIATAHHLDDQLETVLMRMAKGATLKGLRGIPLKRAGYIRPLHGLTRAEIDAYAAEHRIPFREDTSNADTTFLRNHIRQEILPAIQTVFGPSFFKGFEKSLRELDSAWETLSGYLPKYFKSLCRTSGGRISLSLSDYQGLNAFERRALLEYCISTLNHLTSSVSEKFCLSFDRFVKTAGVGARFEVAGNLVVFKNRKALTFVTGQEKTENRVQLFPGETVQWKTYRFSVKPVSRNMVRLDNDPFKEYFCAEGVHFPLTVREWQPGDRFRPLGMHGFKKVSDFFVDSKTERQEKSDVPVICSGSEILWLAGMRLDERFKVKNNCEEIYKIVMEKGA